MLVKAGGDSGPYLLGEHEAGGLQDQLLPGQEWIQGQLKQVNEILFENLK